MVKQLAMRRTLFVFPRDLLAAAWGSASARTSTSLRARLIKEVVANGLATDGEEWLEAARADTLEQLADGSELSAADLRDGCRAGRPPRDGARQVLRRQRPDRTARARPAGGRGA